MNWFVYKSRVSEEQSKFFSHISLIFLCNCEQKHHIKFELSMQWWCRGLWHWSKGGNFYFILKWVLFFFNYFKKKFKLSPIVAYMSNCRSDMMLRSAPKPHGGFVIYSKSCVYILYDYVMKKWWLTIFNKVLNNWYSKISLLIYASYVLYLSLVFFNLCLPIHAFFLFLFFLFYYIKKNTCMF